MVATRRCVVALLLVAASCARPSPSTAGSSPRETESSPRLVKDPNVISMEELRDPVLAGMDALKAIRYLRPSFFRTTGPQSFSNLTAGQVQISHDYGPLQPLSQLSASTPITLFEVRYLNANEAQARFGINANGGPVIVLLNSKP